ncbi:hypothetical protein [Nostoc sp.]|uniref:hypothetical protein n=1 Tax=Nostoc sp. TaxID=1180 RepID=UPI002FFA8867
MKILITHRFPGNYNGFTKSTEADRLALDSNSSWRQPSTARWTGSSITRLSKNFNSEWNGTKKKYSPFSDWNKPLSWEPILGGLPPPLA